MTDLSKLSDSDLEAFSKKDYKSLSDEGLQFLLENPHLYKTKSETKAEAKPELSWLEKTGSNIRDIYGGTARGAVSLPLNWMPETSSKVNEGLQSLGVNPESTPFHVGKAFGETVPMMGIAKGGSLVAEKLGASPELVKNIATQGQIAGESGGISQGFKNAGKSIAVGAPLGITTEALLHGKDAGLKEYALAGAIGGFGPTAMNLIGSGLKTGVDLFTGNSGIEKAKQIAERVVGDKLQSTLSYLRDATLKGLPEDTRTTAQALHGISNPKLASLATIAEKTNGQPFLENEMARNQQYINAHNQVSPNMESALKEESFRNADRLKELNTAHEQTAQELSNLENQFYNGSSKGVSPEKIGQAIVERKKTLEDIAKKKSDINYDNAFALAPKPVDVGHVASVASEIANDLQSLINPKADTKLANSIKRIFTPTEAKAAQNIYGPSGIIGQTKAVEASPPMATLSDLHKVNAALNEQMYNPRIDNTTYSRLNQLKTKIQDTINNPEVFPEDAINAYQNAQTEWKNTVQRPFREGQAEKLTRLNSVGRPTTLPEDVVDSFLKKESYARDFNRMAGDDPNAVYAMSAGVEQKLMNSSNPDKFLDDNKFALKKLYEVAPNLENHLNSLATKVREFGTHKETLSEMKKAIPEQVGKESSNMASTANQARILESPMKSGFKNIEDFTNVSPEELANFDKKAFLTALRNKGKLINEATGGEASDLGHYLNNEQQSHLGKIRKDILVDELIGRQSKANMGATRDIINDTLWREKLPGLLSKVISIGNKGASIVESKVAGAAGRELSKAMESPANLYALFQHLPADERNSILKALKGSGPTVLRSALSATNQQ